jgi:hypothetical protein
MVAAKAAVAVDVVAVVVVIIVVHSAGCTKTSESMSDKIIHRFESSLGTADLEQWFGSQTCAASGVGDELQRRN